MASMASWGIMSWTPAFVARSMGWSQSKIGFVLGASIAIFGTIGVVGGGWLGDRLIRSGDPCGRLTAISLALLISFLGAVIFHFLHNRVLLAVAFGFHILGAWMVVGNGAAVLQQIFPDRLRGQGTATYMLATNLIGVGLGPTSVALLTDYVFEDTQMLRYSLLISPPAAIVVASIAFLLLRAPFRQLKERRLTGAEGI
jgi:MFS family permease